jgi:tetratricopeptide (TPR) repeat protein
LPALERAVTADPRASHVAHLGRAQLAMGRAAEAVASLRRALALAEQEALGVGELRKIHYQLGLALRKEGQTAEAAAHLAAAREAGGDDAASGTPAAGGAPRTSSEAAALAGWPAPDRAALARRVRGELARAHLNLGVIEAQAGRFAEAAAEFEKAAAIDAGFPQVQSSLGIAYFNARQFDRATAPLSRALEANPDDRGLARMLALAWLNSGEFARAAELLRDDPERESDPSLRQAYAMALARSRPPGEPR